MDNPERRRSPDYDVPGRDRALRELFDIISPRPPAGDGRTPGSEFERGPEFELAQQAAELYRRVIETSPDAILVTDLSGTVLMCNEQAAVQQGSGDPAGLLGLNAFDFVAPEDRERAVENARRTLESGSVRGVEYDLLRQDGTRVPAELSASVIRDPQGQPRAFIAVVRNISERKRAAKALRSSEEKLLLGISQMPSMIWTTDGDLRVTSLSGAALSRPGIDLAEQLGRTLYDIFGGDEIGALPIAAHERAARGEEAEYQQTVEDRHFEVRVRPFRDEHDQIQGCVGVAMDVTERRQAEDALLVTEEKFRTLTEMNSAATFVYRDGRLVYANSAAAAITGYSMEELMAVDPWQILHADFREDVRKTLESALDGSMPSLEGRDTIKIVTKSGAVRWAAASAALVQWEGGAAALATLFDITELKQAEEALRDSEVRYRTLYDDNPSMYFTVSADGRVLSVNEFGAEQLGYSPDELVGRSVLEVFYEEDKQDVTEQLAACVERPGEVRHWEFRKVRKDGEVIWVEEAARATLGTAGEPIVLIVCEDITERRRTEEALRESEERYRALYQDNPSMYFTVSADGKVLSVNAFGGQQLGYSPDELVGRSVLEVFHEEDKQDVTEQLAACVQSPGEMRHWEFRKVRKDGEVIWVKEAARATLGAAGETIVLIVCEDITARKRVEDDLARAREELERKVELQVKSEAAYGLTFRELTVLHLVATGSSDKEMAETLGISRLTVSKHVANVLTKMGAATRSEASARAVRESLLE